MKKNGWEKLINENEMLSDFLPCIAMFYECFVWSVLLFGESLTNNSSSGIQRNMGHFKK